VPAAAVGIIRSWQRQQAHRTGTGANSGLILDALDECREQDVVLVHVREMLSWNYTKTRVILTSRNAVQPVEGESFPIRKQNMDEDIKRNILSW
jgi:hypothetical protein